MSLETASGSPIHMNGRVYDPAIGRFLSADPNIPHPYNSQSYNRYSYVLNNPLSLVDPSGFVDDEIHDNICDRDCQSELPEDTQEDIRNCQAQHGGWGCALVNGEVMPISEVQGFIQHEFQQRQETLGDPNLIEKYKKVAAEATNEIKYYMGLDDEEFANSFPGDWRNEDGQLKRQDIRTARQQIIYSLKVIQMSALFRFPEHVVVGAIETTLRNTVTRGIGKLFRLRGISSTAGAILEIQWGIPKEDYGGNWHPVFECAADGCSIYYDTVNYREMTEFY